jgi:hypothetical protein
MRVTIEKATRAAISRADCEIRPSPSTAQELYSTDRRGLTGKKLWKNRLLLRPDARSAPGEAARVSAA